MTAFRNHDFQLSTEMYGKKMSATDVIQWKPCHAPGKMHQQSREMATPEPGFPWMTQLSRLFGAFWVGPGRTNS